MSHTPLPWSISGQLIVGAPEPFPNPKSPPAGKVVAELRWDFNGDRSATEYRINDKERQANADFIVRAVNSHDELLEACKDTERDLSDLSGLLADEHAVVLNVLRDRLEAAIAKATT